MTVVANDVRKVVVLGWDLDVVKGKTASIQAEGKELRVVGNTGTANVFYPADWTGSTDFTVNGSKEGTDTGTIEVTGAETGPVAPEIPEIPTNGGEENVDAAKTDFVTVSDMREGEALREFVGIALADSDGPGSVIPVQVNFDKDDSGFNEQIGVKILNLKDLGDGTFGA